MMKSLFDLPRKQVLLFVVALFFVKTTWADSSHIEIRTFMIQSQLAQMDGKGILVVGDSIVESWLSGQVGACQSLNAGLGGGGYVTQLLFSMN